MTNRKKLVDVFPDIIENGGIFTALENYNVPWKTDIDDVPLDLEYFYNISGQKFTSPLVVRLLATNETLTANNITSLASVIYNMCSKYWEKEYATLSLQYSPISNYDMVEEETIASETTDNVTHTGTQTTTHTGTQNTTHTGTVGTSDSETVSGSGSGSTDNGLYGFNSVSAVGDTETDTTTSNTNTATGSSTRTDNLTDGRTDNLTDGRTDNLTDAGTGTSDTTRTLTRSGNIGVTTSQQMLQSERDLWMWNFFYNVVFPDIDKVLTIATYSNV